MTALQEEPPTNDAQPRVQHFAHEKFETLLISQRPLRRLHSTSAEVYGLVDGDTGDCFWAVDSQRKPR